MTGEDGVSGRVPHQRFSAYFVRVGERQSRRTRCPPYRASPTHRPRKCCCGSAASSPRVLRRPLVRSPIASVSSGSDVRSSLTLFQPGFTFAGRVFCGSGRTSGRSHRRGEAGNGMGRFQPWRLGFFAAGDAVVCWIVSSASLCKRPSRHPLFSSDAVDGRCPSRRVAIPDLVIQSSLAVSGLGHYRRTARPASRIARTSLFGDLGGDGRAVCVQSVTGL